MQNLCWDHPQTRPQDAPDIEETPGAVRCRLKKNGAGWLKTDGECSNRFKLSTYELQDLS